MANEVMGPTGIRCALQMGRAPVQPKLSDQTTIKLTVEQVEKLNELHVIALEAKRGTPVPMSDLIRRAIELGLPRLQERLEDELRLSKQKP